LSSSASKTGTRSPGEELMTCNTSAVAASRASDPSSQARGEAIDAANLQTDCRIFAFIAGTASGLEKASAQEATNPGGYQFFVTPYLWLASVHTTTLTPLAREPQVNSNVSTIDLLSHFDGTPFMAESASMRRLRKLRL
jgi:hypothetical protein